MKEETSAEIKKYIDQAEKELREKFSELIFDYGDNDGQYFLCNLASGFNVLLEYARKWQKAKEAEEEAIRQAELQRQREEEERLAAASEGVIPEAELTEEEKERLNERQTIEELIRNKPEEVAVLIKTWLSED